MERPVQIATNCDIHINHEKFVTHNFLHVAIATINSHDTKQGGKQ